MTKVRLDEGTVFRAPLDDSRWSIGVVARRSPKSGPVNGIYAYFFGPFTSPPELPEVISQLRWDKAVIILKCSASRLHEGRWPIIGKLYRWDRKDWPLVRFLRVDVLRKKNYCVTYDQDDVSKVVSEIETDVLEGLIPDRLSGARAAEIHLSAAMGAANKIN